MKTWQVDTVGEELNLNSNDEYSYKIQVATHDHLVDHVSNDDGFKSKRHCHSPLVIALSSPDDITDHLFCLGRFQSRSRYKSTSNVLQRRYMHYNNTLLICPYNDFEGILKVNLHAKRVRTKLHSV